MSDPSMPGTGQQSESHAEHLLAPVKAAQALPRPAPAAPRADPGGARPPDAGQDDEC